jgi:NAD(P)-dependent dehydrogenase (short-subunit alcohol dehydrogenase family)
MATHKTALVTGANRGIGFAVARQLAAKGWRVIRAARRPPNDQFIQLDITDPHSIDAAAKHVDALDVLVNNAGVLEENNASVLDVSAELVLRAFTTNALGALRVAQAFVPLLLKSARGRIINVSSGAGQLADPMAWAPAYSISKTALNAVTVQLAAALRDKGVAVNSVCPGWVRTEMGGPNAPRSVEQGADTIVWLATEAPQSLTGKFLRDRKEIPW